MRRIFLTAWLIAALAPSLVWGQAAVTNTVSPWSPNPATNSSNPYTVTTSTGTFNLPAFASSPGPPSVNFCNTGSNPAYVVMGNGPATSGNSLVAAGICKLIARGGATTFSAISTGNSTTLNAETGTGSPQSAVPGSGGGSGGAVPALVANSVLATDGTPAMSWVTTLPSALTYPAATVTGSFTATGLVTLADVATQATNTVLGNATSGTASPTALAVGGCSSASSALIWTTNTGFGCNTSITAAAVTGLSVTAGKTLTVSNNLTLTATDGATLAIGSGGTLASAAYVATGTSGGTIPLLNGTNTWSSAQTFSAAITASNASMVTQTVGGRTFTYGSDGFNMILTSSGGGNINFVTGATNAIDSSGNFTFGAGMTNAHLSTGTNADVVCVSSGGVFLIQAAASCTISSMRFKNMKPDLDPTPTASLEGVLALKPVAFTRKEESDHPNPDRNFGTLQDGLTAENVAEVFPRCALYEDDMVTPKGYRTECVLAEVIGAIKAQHHKISNLRPG